MKTTKRIRRKDNIVQRYHVGRTINLRKYMVVGTMYQDGEVHNLIKKLISKDEAKQFIVDWNNDDVARKTACCLKIIQVDPKKYRMNMTYKELKMSGSHITPYADSDGDGVVNCRDCRPLNPRKQDSRVGNNWATRVTDEGNKKILEKVILEDSGYGSIFVIYEKIQVLPEYREIKHKLIDEFMGEKSKRNLGLTDTKTHNIALRFAKRVLKEKLYE